MGIGHIEFKIKVHFAEETKILFISLVKVLCLEPKNHFKVVYMWEKIHSIKQEITQKWLFQIDNVKYIGIQEGTVGDLY